MRILVNTLTTPTPLEIPNSNYGNRFHNRIRIGISDATGLNTLNTVRGRPGRAPLSDRGANYVARSAVSSGQISGF